MRPAPGPRSLLIALACLALAPAAHAAGVSLRWDTCYGNGGVQNKNFACDTNTGGGVLVCSFALGADMHQVAGGEITLDLGAAGGTLPSWWQMFQVNTCRRTSISVAFAAPVSCADWAGGLAAGGIGVYNIGYRGPNTARVRIAEAVPANNFKDLVAGQEYYSCDLTIDYQKTVGTGSCAGCSTPACLVLTSINLTTPVVENNRLLTGPANGVDSNWATWQGGGGVVVGGQAGCPAATPTAKSTWGAVK